MTFIDDIIIYVKSGNGGNGCVSFHKDKYISRGKPNGGDGGNGGSVFICCNYKLNSLYSFSYKRSYIAGNGCSGKSNNKFGKNGEDIYIYMPLGTKIYSCDSLDFILEVNSINYKFMLIKGGKKGIGNSKFKNSKYINSYSKGVLGNGYYIRLLFCLYADIGLMGMPNAGKSTLLSYLTSSKSIISYYQFTTLYPNLGVLNLSSNIDVVISDMPGIIYGASEGIGLGLKFLNHISNSNLLFHLVDISSNDEKIIEASIKLVENEILSFKNDLLKKDFWILLNKSDKLLDSRVLEIKSFIEERKKDVPVFVISSITGFGIDSLCKELKNYLVMKKNL